MSKLDEDSSEWFKLARRRCVDHLRALVSINSAQQYAAKVIDCWTGNDFVVLSALHTACVAAYCRPFTSQKTKDGQRLYPDKLLKNTQGFDKELHEHLIILRKKMIAHSDYDILRSTMYMMSMPDNKTPISVGINVKSLAGIELSQLAERYVAHFSFCVQHIQKTFKDEFRELANHLRKHPNHFEETMQRKKIDLPPSKELKKLTGPVGPASTVEEPSFPADLSGYRYILYRHELPLIESGSYKFTNDDGSQGEMTLVVGPPTITKF